ncbi:MAG: aldehyde dehydrogenase family protein [Acidobacteriota bacterium]
MSVLHAYETMSYGPAPESPADAVAWLDRHGRRFGLFIGGAWSEATSGELFPSLDPSSGDSLAEISQGSEADVDRAVDAARAALPAWGELGGHRRSRYLYAIARQVQKHSRLLAVLESMDNGKPIRETRDIDVPLVARHFYHHAGWAQLLEEEFPGQEAVGVCGQIIPWNFPLLMLAWKIAPALACGNTVVLKPAEYTSLTALAMAEICQEVGLPEGVVNIVTGDGRTGDALVRHPDVDKIAFTGSTEVGRLIRRATAGSGKKLSLELGGKSPFIVFDDADIDSAIEGVVDAIWFNQGQVCCAGSRLLVQESIAEAFYAKLRRRMETLRVGHPLDKAIDIGAIVAPVQLERIGQLVEEGKAEGAVCHQPSWAVPQEGWFYPPTLFTGVEPSSSLAQVEIFGPVMVAMTFRTPSEAVALANDTRYGLAASVWSENVNLALDIAPQLAAGVVWINSTNLFDAAAGFGGYRESGFGREGGREGLGEYLRSAVTVNPPSGSPDHDPEPTPSDLGIVGGGLGASGIDRTAKMYIGGKQQRPDGGNSYPVRGHDGVHLGDAGWGNRKDIRNAVEAARKGAAWSKTTGHLRAQILYYLAENLDARAGEFEARLHALTGGDGRAEVQASIERLFYWAAWADKHDGAVHGVPMRNVTLAMPEPWGILAVCCPDEQPLLGFLSLVAPALAMGNRVIAVPSPLYPLAATDLYQVLETSDVPGGALNIVTGDRESLAPTLAQHDEVACLWYFGTGEGVEAVERESAGNLKRTWAHAGALDATKPHGPELLKQATQTKNIWVPYGD